MTDNWAITLYQRYVQLYGEPIEQPLPKSPDDELRPEEGGAARTP